MVENKSIPEGIRKRSRVEVTLDVHLACPGRKVKVQSQNISLKGILCTPNPGLNMDQICDVWIELSPEVKLSVQGKVVRSDRIYVALDFLKMDEESFQHLYNLDKLNADDPESIKTELHFPAFDPHRNNQEQKKK